MAVKTDFYAFSCYGTLSCTCGLFPRIYSYGDFDAAFFQNPATKIGHCKEKLNNFGASNCKILHISFFGIEVCFQQNPGLIGSKHETFPPEDICNDFKNDVFLGIQKLVTLFFVIS